MLFGIGKFIIPLHTERSSRTRSKIMIEYQPARCIITCAVIKSHTDILIDEITVKAAVTEKTFSVHLRIPLIKTELRTEIKGIVIIDLPLHSEISTKVMTFII